MIKRKVLTALTVFAMVAMPVVAAMTTNVDAGGVPVTLDPTELAANAAGDVEVTYTSTGQYQSGDIITVTVDEPAGAALAEGTCAPDGSTITGTTVASTGTPTSSVIEFEVAGTSDTNAEVTLCVAFPATDAGNYSVSVHDSRASGDFGAALLYVGDANDVLITASVVPTLAFVIRNAADTGDTNVCELGALTTNAVNDCEYRLKVTTNADSGYAVSFSSDGNLTDGTNFLTNAADDATGTLLALGTEGYGFYVVGGNATDGTVTVNYAEGATNHFDTTAGQLLYSVDGPNIPDVATDSALVNHSAAISSATATGNYSQTVTYTVAATF